MYLCLHIYFLFVGLGDFFLVQAMYTYRGGLWMDPSYLHVKDCSGHIIKCVQLMDIYCIYNI